MTENFLTWTYESHYNGARVGFHIQTENKLVLNFYELDDSRFYKDFQLEPLTKYIATVHCVGTDIVAQADQGANVSVLGNWNYSTEFNYGKGTFEGDLTMRFRTNSTGKIRLSLRLGFWCSEAKGKAEFTNFRLEEDESAVVIGTKQIRLDLSIDDLSLLDLDRVEWWLEQNNTAYEKMKELYGKAPFNDDPIFIEARDGIKCYAFAGNPIVWNKRCMFDFFQGQNFSACFGTIHEIGHTFDQTVLTHINPEFMANFGLLYAVDNANLDIYFDNELTKGDGLIHGFYKRMYEKTIAKGTYHHDGLEYCMMRIKEMIGWEPFRAAMRELIRTNPRLQKGNECLSLWLDLLTKISGKDVRSTFLPGELQLIMSQPKL